MVFKGYVKDNDSTHCLLCIVYNSNCKYDQYSLGHTTEFCAEHPRLGGWCGGLYKDPSSRVKPWIRPVTAPQRVLSRRVPRGLEVREFEVVKIIVIFDTRWGGGKGGALPCDCYLGMVWRFMRFLHLKTVQEAIQETGRQEELIRYRTEQRMAWSINRETGHISIFSDLLFLYSWRHRTQILMSDKYHSLNRKFIKTD